jgi:hypothetical protein
MIFADFLGDDADDEDDAALLWALVNAVCDNFPRGPGESAAAYYDFMSMRKGRWGAWCHKPKTADPTQVCHIGLTSLFTADKKIEKVWMQLFGVDFWRLEHWIQQTMFPRELPTEVEDDLDVELNSPKVRVLFVRARHARTITHAPPTGPRGQRARGR